MSHWTSTCKKCGTVANVVIGRKPSTSCPKCSAPTEAVILHRGANRKLRRKFAKLASREK
jgi:hypothetical protein